MKPTIGRVVIFTDTSEEFRKRNNGYSTAPATVVRVWNEQGTVNLKVHLDGPQDDWQPSTMFKDEWDKSFPNSSLVRYWSWPEIVGRPQRSEDVVLGPGPQHGPDQRLLCDQVKDADGSVRRV